jgi:Tol biopolymer transport system component
MRLRTPLALVCCLLALSGCRFAYWSPDSKQLALDGGGKLSLFTLRSGNRKPIPTPDREVVSPEWSPNGNRLAYYCLAGEGKRVNRVALWVYSLENERERQIAERPLPKLPRVKGEPNPDPDMVAAYWTLVLKQLGAPAWSADGKTLACTWPGEEGASRIELFNLPDDKSRPLPGSGAALSNPSWSADGKYLAYMEWTKRDSITPMDGSLQVYEPQAGRSSVVWRPDSPHSVISGYGPHWSNDGRIILYTRGIVDQSRLEFQVHAVPPTGGKSQLVATLPGFCGMISPDLTTACYVSSEAGSELYRVSLARAPFNAPKLLDEISRTVIQKAKKTKDPEEEFTRIPFPSISPDMRRMALWLDGDKKGELRLYDLATGQKQIHQLASNR